jgi:AcrR family transcriptional regulator
MARKPAPDARERLLESASRLFNERGVHAVGLQQIIGECGCGKNMLYREFASKDDLVVAWLERCQDTWEAIVDGATRPLADDPAGQLVAIVRVSAEEAAVPGYRGCPMRNTRAEFPDPAHPAHQVSVAYVDAVRARLRELAERAGASDPGPLADRLMLILDGLLSNSAMLGPEGAAAAAVDFAQEVIRAAIPTRAPTRTTPRRAHPGLTVASSLT